MWKKWQLQVGRYCAFQSLALPWPFAVLISLIWWKNFNFPSAKIELMSSILRKYSHDLAKYTPRKWSGYFTGVWSPIAMEPTAAKRLRWTICILSVTMTMQSIGPSLNPMSCNKRMNSSNGFASVSKLSNLWLSTVSLGFEIILVELCGDVLNFEDLLFKYRVDLANGRLFNFPYNAKYV